MAQTITSQYEKFQGLRPGGRKGQLHQLAAKAVRVWLGAKISCANARKSGSTRDKVTRNPHVGQELRRERISGLAEGVHHSSLLLGQCGLEDTSPPLSCGSKTCPHLQNSRWLARKPEVAGSNPVPATSPATRVPVSPRRGKRPTESTPGRVFMLFGNTCGNSRELFSCTR